jgi:hypothetical protein
MLLAVADLPDRAGGSGGVPARQRLAIRLMHLAEQVAESYCLFAVGRAPDDDPKAFAAHHTACKTALAHLDLLVRLARTIAPEQAAELHPTLLIGDARRALSAGAAELELTAERSEALREVALLAAQDTIYGDDDEDEDAAGG